MTTELLAAPFTGGRRPGCPEGRVSHKRYVPVTYVYSFVTIL
jgi:hypothetical protein